MRQSITAAIGAIALLSVGLTAAGAETIEDTVQRTLAFAAGSRLEVSNTNGDIKIETWDRDEIQIEARKRVKSSSEDKARSAFEELEVIIDENGSGVTIETRYPRSKGSWWSNGSASVRYQIRVPKEADLNLDTVNGKITVEGVHGEIELATTNGGIDVEDAGGSVSARTTNGGIDVELRQVSADEEMNFRTTNGSVTLSLPSNIQATLSARTTNGSVQTDFPITIQGTFRKNRLEGEINGGGASIELKTTNGGIRIRKL